MGPTRQLAERIADAMLRTGLGKGTRIAVKRRQGEREEDLGGRTEPVIVDTVERVLRQHALEWLEGPAQMVDELREPSEAQRDADDLRDRFEDVVKRAKAGG